MRLSLLCLLTLLTFLSVFSQPNRETLTNEKIIALVRMQLSNAVIVEKIRRSECNCDTTTSGLAALKAAKVADEIIMAMLDPTGGGYSETTIGRKPSPEIESSSATPAIVRGLKQAGIYLFETGKMQLIEPAVYSGGKTGTLGSILSGGIIKGTIKAKLTRKSANLQTNSRRPEFYFVFSVESSNGAAVMSGIASGGATSPNEFALINMKIKSNSREASIGEFSIMGTSTGVKDSEAREFSFDKLSPGVYKVVPRIDLTPGEYCFFYAGANGAGKVFDFGIK